jgi:hypothetical protein
MWIELFAITTAIAIAATAAAVVMQLPNRNLRF